MATENRQMGSMQLANGLTLFFEDRSRTTVSGHWQVILFVFIPLDVRSVFNADTAVPLEDIVALLGISPEYRFEKVRNFIKKEDVPLLLDRMKQEFLDTHISYISRQEFASRFLLREYRRAVEERELRRVRDEATRGRPAE